MDIGNSVFRVAQFIKRHYSSLIVLSLAAGLALGLVTGTPGTLIRAHSALIIAVMIWAMSFAITPRALSGAVRNVKGYGAGLLLNFVAAPVVCWILAMAFLRGLPDAAVGLMLVGVTPCAGMALVWTGMLDGNLSLSLLINAGTMMLAPFLIPVLMFMMAGSIVTVDMPKMLLDLMLTILTPVLLGVVSRWSVDRRTMADPGRSSKHIVLSSAIAAVMAMVLMFMVMQTSVELIVSNVAALPPIVVSVSLVFPIMFLLVWNVASPFETPSRIALTYASGMKNLPIALGIAVTSFGGLAPLSVAISFVFQMITAVGMYRWIQRRTTKK